MSASVDGRFGCFAPIGSDLKDAILALAETSVVRSLSLPFQDGMLWDELVKIQLRKAEAKGVRPFYAFPLFRTFCLPGQVGEDEPMIDRSWGGKVKVVLGDSFLPADVFAFPDGRGLSDETTASAANLSHALFGTWYRERSNFLGYFITCDLNCGSIAGTTRTVYGDWVLYSSIDTNYAENLRLPRPAWMAH
jgi:hypothetical protein